MSLISGKEKFWTALLSGGAVAAVSTLALWLTSLTGAVEAPDSATIATAITGLVAAAAAAAGAYLATNSEPTSISVPAEPVAEPTPPITRTVITGNTITPTERT